MVLIPMGAVVLELEPAPLIPGVVVVPTPGVVVVVVPTPPTVPVVPIVLVPVLVPPRVLVPVAVVVEVVVPVVVPTVEVAPPTVDVAPLVVLGNVIAGLGTGVAVPPVSWVPVMVPLPD